MSKVGELIKEALMEGILDEATKKSTDSKSPVDNAKQYHKKSVASYRKSLYNENEESKDPLHHLIRHANADMDEAVNKIAENHASGNHKLDNHVIDAMAKNPELSKTHATLVDHHMSSKKGHLSKENLKDIYHHRLSDGSELLHDNNMHPENDFGKKNW